MKNNITTIKNFIKNEYYDLKSLVVVFILLKYFVNLYFALKNYFLKYKS